jgi:hypothetical protein
MRQAHRKMKRKRESSCRQEGALLVEMAFVLPIFAIIFLIIIDGGLAIREHQLLQNAAREGAHYASLYQGISQAEIKQVVVDYCAEEHLVVNPANVTITPHDIPLSGGFFAQGFMVTVSYTKQMLILGAPLLPSGQITLTGSSVFRQLY